MRKPLSRPKKDGVSTKRGKITVGKGGKITVDGFSVFLAGKNKVDLFNGTELRPVSIRCGCTARGGCILKTERQIGGIAFTCDPAGCTGGCEFVISTRDTTIRIPTG